VPEGDTIHRVANVLRRALAGRVVTGFEIVAPRMSSDAARFEVVGSVVRSVESNGKHLLITFARGDDDVVLHTHMKMTGMWHVYRPGERWWSPPSDARVVIRTDEFVAPCFTPPVVELMTTREIAFRAVLPDLGPDIIRDEFDEGEALRRLRASPAERDIATALLDQRTISGIGNVFKCEALFLERVSPWAKVADLDDATLRRLVAQARKGQAPAMHRGLACQADQLLDEGPKVLGLRHRGHDALVLDQRGGHVADHGVAVAGRPAQLVASFAMSHGCSWGSPGSRRA